MGELQTSVITQWIKHVVLESQGMINILVGFLLCAELFLWSSQRTIKEETETQIWILDNLDNFYTCYNNTNMKAKQDNLSNTVKDCNFVELYGLFYRF